MNIIRESTVSAITPYPTPQLSQNSQGLSIVVSDSLKGANGTYGIAILNLRTNESFLQNAGTLFDSESLYKLWVMAVVYRKIEQGLIKPSDVISEKSFDLDKQFYIDKEFAEKKDETIRYKISEALNQMITVSNNYAGLLLADKIGLQNMQNFLVQYSLNNSKVGFRRKSPVTSAFDTLIFFKYLYENRLANVKHTKEMITLLKLQVLNDKLPKYLPVEVSVAHKTGELDPYSHDAGIVYAKDSNFIIVVLSKTNDRSQANERIANLSKKVYNYFETK